MEIRLASFLLGIGVAWIVPLLTRSLRPLAIEATAAGMGLIEDARRVIAEQVEMVEDLAAEVRARREEIIGAAETNGAAQTNGAVGEVEVEDEVAEPAAVARPRRRANGASRRRAS